MSRLSLVANAAMLFAMIAVWVAVYCVLCPA